MLLAQPLLAAEVFFPPWYFWLFVLALVTVIFTAIVTMVYLNLQAETRRRVHDRETAARLIETLVVQRNMSADEVEQVLDSYWRLGTFWYRFSRWFAPSKTQPTTKMHSKLVMSTDAERF